MFIKQSSLQRMSVIGALSLLLVLVLPFFLAPSAEAAGLQQVYVRPDRLIAATATTGLICAKTAVADVTEANVVVTFPTGFTLGLAATFTVTTTNLPSGASAWAGIGTATDVTTQVVTFPSSNLTADTLYCFNWSSSTAVTNSSAGNNKTGTIASGGNSSGYALSIISDDQIIVSATVPATFTFALGANVDSIGTLSTSIASSSGVTATMTTNADSGWVAWVKSANAALNSASTGATIATAGSIDDTPSDLDSVTGYVLDVDITTDSGTGVGVVQQNPGYGDEYAGADATEGGTLSTTFQPIAEGTGTTGGDVLTLIERAKITAVQAAATDYTDTLTVIAAARF